MSVAVALTDRRKLARDIGSTVGVRFAALPISIVASIVLARSLQPAEKGTYTTVMTIGELAVVLGSLWIDAAAYYLARVRAHGVVGLRRAVLGASLVIGGTLSVTIMAAAALSTALGLPQSARWALIALSPFGIVALTRAGLESFFARSTSSTRSTAWLSSSAQRSSPHLSSLRSMKGLTLRLRWRFASLPARWASRYSWDSRAAEGCDSACLDSTERPRARSLCTACPMPPTASSRT